MKAALTISRRSDYTITICIKDGNSRVEFVELELTPEDFALAITGFSGVECQAKYNNLDKVGKTKISEKRSVECYVGGYDKTKLSEWLKENCQEEGWTLNTYLGSQGSVVYKDGKTILNYSVVKYV